MNALELLLSSSPMRALGWTLLHFLWQGVLLFAVHELLQWSLRRRSAALRYVTACVVLLAMLSSAVFTLQSELRRVPVGAGEVQTQATRLETSAQSAFRSAREGATPPVVVSTPSDPHVRPSDPGAAHSPLWYVVAADPLVRARDFLQARFPGLDTLLPWMVTLWFVGVFLLTTRLAIGWQEARWLRTRAVRPVAARTREQVRALVHRLRISRPVRVLESSLAEVPTVVGWLRPVVLLPTASLTGLPPRHLEALLAHELSHVRRHDYLINLMQTLVETTLFYHPAVWWVSHRIRDERENCCDDVAVQVCGDAVLYARALTHMEELRRGPLQPELAMAADGGSLVQRVRRVVGRGGEPATPGAGVVVGAVLLGLSSLVIVSAARTAETTAHVDEVSAPDASQPVHRTASPGGKIAGFTEAQPAPQLPRPVSSQRSRPRSEPETQPQARPSSRSASEPRPRGDVPSASDRPVFTLEEIVQLEKHEIDTDYYDRMTKRFGPLDVEEVVALRVHDADPEYVDDMFEQFGRIDVEELLALRVHDVDVDYVREISRSFDRRIEVEEIVELSLHRLHSDDLEEFQQLNLRGATIEELAQAAQVGIDADDLGELQDALGPIRLDDGMTLLLLGVDGSEIEELQDMGMHHPRVDELIQMYSQGLTADVIDTILDDDMDEVPVETLLLFKDLGLEDVFRAEFRRRNE